LYRHPASFHKNTTFLVVRVSPARDRRRVVAPSDDEGHWHRRGRNLNRLHPGHRCGSVQADCHPCASSIEGPAAGSDRGTISLAEMKQPPEANDRAGGAAGRRPRTRLVAPRAAVFHSGLSRSSMPTTSARPHVNRTSCSSRSVSTIKPSRSIACHCSSV